MMTAQHLRDLELARRYVTLVAVILDTRATLIDESIDLHNRFMGMLFSYGQAQSRRPLPAVRQGDQRLEHTLSEPISSRVGLWSKVDSFVYLDDVKIEPARR